MAVEQINKYRSPIVLGLLILFLLLFAFFMLGVQPAKREIKDQESQLSQLNEQNSLVQSKIDERQSDTDQAAEEAELLAQLPTGDSTGQLILDLRKIGSFTETRLKDISFSVGEQNPIDVMTGLSTGAYPTLKQLNMTAVVEGNYIGISNWLLALQSLPRIVNVDTLSFQRSDVGNIPASSSIIAANVSFSAYFEDTEADN